jgi:hypothetical protein
MSPTTNRQHVGLVITGLLSLLNVTSVLMPTPDGEEGPPFAILVLGTVLGIVGLVATILAWRGSRVALRVAAATLVVNTLATLPAFFVDVPAWIKLTSGISVLLAVAALVLMFSPSRRPVPVTD